MSYRDAPLRDVHTGVRASLSESVSPYRLAVSDLQYARQQQKRQDEDKQPQLDRNFEGIRALRFTKEEKRRWFRNLGCTSAPRLLQGRMFNGWIHNALHGQSE